MSTIPQLPPQAITLDVWDKKYRWKKADGSSDEKTIEDSLVRAVRGVYALDPDPKALDAAIEAIRCREIVPAGRIHAGAGTDKRVTLINCFVLNSIADSMASEGNEIGIMDSLRNAAITMQMGGGIGMDFSPLRPKGARVKRIGSVASGPLHFMDMWDAMCKTIMSSGSRRGAMMAVMDVSHPDIVEFITAKRIPGRLTQFNMSVLVSDAFMKAVEVGDDWHLTHSQPPALSDQTSGRFGATVEAGYIYRTIPARELWNMILRNTYEYSEPGVIFIDRVNQKNNLRYCETIRATNPCFTGDTLVRTENGARRFDDLAVVGKTVSVLTRLDDGSLVYRDMVAPRLTQRQAPLVEVVLCNPAQQRMLICCTPNHEFFPETGGRREAAALQLGERVVGLHAGEGVLMTHVVEEVNALPYREDVYCGTVPNVGCFFIESNATGDNVLVSNCGEQPLPPNGACDLGGINLPMFVRGTLFSEDDAGFDFTRLKAVVKIMVRLLDNVLDVTHFPLPQQKIESDRKRRIGLGITGLADMLAMLGMRYGSNEAVNMTRGIMRNIAVGAYDASCQLAMERRAFPLFDVEEFKKSDMVKRLPLSLQRAIEEHGLRNGVLLTVAPQGTTSLYYDNVSSGLEPIFALSAKRNVLQEDGTTKTFTVEDYAWRLYQHMQGIAPGDDEIPPFFVTSDELTVEEHLQMQAACQEWVDASISKTINCPKSMTFEEFEKVYSRAYELGLKGCTTYRPSDVRGAVLEASDAPAAVGDTSRGHGTGGAGGTASMPLGITISPAPAQPVAEPSRRDLGPRARTLPGVTYKIKWQGEENFYITINNIVALDGRQRPYELFINSNSVKHAEWIVALTRTVSAIFRRAAVDGGDVSFLLEQFAPVHAPSGGMWENQRYVPSLVAAIGDVIGEHLQSLGLRKPKEEAQQEDTLSVVSKTPEIVSAPMGESCPRCGRATIVHSEGCANCLTCGYSNCG